LATLDGSKVMLYDHLNALRQAAETSASCDGDLPATKRPILLTAGSIS
jgi:hypothetical protein